MFFRIGNCRVGSGYDDNFELRGCLLDGTISIFVLHFFQYFEARSTGGGVIFKLLVLVVELVVLELDCKLD